MARHRPARIFTPATGAVLPDFAALDDVVAGEPVELELTTTYLDTAALDLLRHGVTLHRTHGGTDDGWVLDLRGSGSGGGAVDRVEVGLSGGRVNPPKQLRDLVLALTLGAPFVEVATLRTERRAVDLSTGGEVVAWVADDRVAGEALLRLGDAEQVMEGVDSVTGLPPTTTWREWLLEGDDASVLDEVEEPMAALAEPEGTGDHADRLRHLLGDLVDLATPEAARAPKRVKPGKPAARVLHHYLLAQHDAVLPADLAVRRELPTGVHDLRVALRRLRSTLATFRPLVDRGTTDAVREQMREVSALLGDARDAEVVGARLAQLLDDEPANLRLGAARRTIGDDSRARLRLGRRTAEDTMASEEYVALLRSLRDLAADPPWAAEAEEPAADVVTAQVARDLRRLRTRMAAVDDAEGSAERARLLHEARKAAKRLRYACEAGEVVVGDDARRLRRATKDLQEVLGDHHDTMATRSVLHRLAGRGDLHPGTAFTLGRLHAREEQAARRLEREVGAVWARLDRAKVTGWL